MRREYLVTCELNMCANCVETILVTTNLPEKAKRIAERKLKNEGAFYVRVISCKQA